MLVLSILLFLVYHQNTRSMLGRSITQPNPYFKGSVINYGEGGDYKWEIVGPKPFASPYSRQT